MTELVTVYVSTPPNGKSNPGVILYQGIYFSVTLREAVVPVASEVGFEIVCGRMETAFEIMDRFVNAYQKGLLQIAPECLWRDPTDQRPAGENRSDFENQAASGKLLIRKVRKAETQNGKVYVGLFTNADAKSADVLVFDKKRWNDISIASGVNWGNQDIGKVAVVKFEIEYSVNGKYKNFERIVEPTDIPF